MWKGRKEEPAVDGAAGSVRGAKHQESLKAIIFHMVEEGFAILDTLWPQNYGAAGFGGARRFLEIAGRLMSDADGAGKQGPERLSLTEDAKLANRLGDLDKRLDARMAERKAAAPVEAPKRPGLAMALRLGADFVAGVVVGAALGWGFDKLLDTSPWGLIVFFLLGFAAGILSVMRTAGLIAKRPGLDDDPASRRFD